TIDGVSKSFQYTYDALGRPSTLTYPDGEQVTYGYDHAGRLYSLSGYVTGMFWSPSGQLQQMNYANGTISTFTYDANREWLTGATVRKSDGTTLYTATYGYNDNGTVQTTTQGAPTALKTNSFTYDGLDRLLSVSGDQSQTFTYDATGNMLTNSLVGS